MEPKQQIDVNVIVAQALGVQADAMSQTRALTQLVSQMAQEIQKLQQEVSELKKK
jgi:acid phosphatase family membrane protein YuiD